ncbi:MAG: hypothetical protein IT306_26725 [Chloroflexi bacterium]|nr:hypothetical protein [Chloroflexota bacterium]
MTVSFPEGTVTLLPRRAPVGHSDPIRGTSLAAYPLGESGVDAVRAALAAADAGASTLHPAVVEPDQQPAAAVLGLTEQQAVVVGVALGLRAILFWDGRRGSILACAPADQT